MEPSETARERSRASTATGLLNGLGVAPFGNNKRPCLNSRRLRPCLNRRRRGGGLQRALGVGYTDRWGRVEKAAFTRGENE
ncbi:MAG: hypothetical protein LBD24_01970 [Spirochaetaceae bacterium]|nr:hypothetical protein [Spirochaetaceae bacterium]